MKKEIINFQLLRSMTSNSSGKESIVKAPEVEKSFRVSEMHENFVLIK